ncbi:MAG: hypothetical protein EGP82_09965 [Odoribacter splanchnicus]|nr:hypothetical protein [Odoribacter splanchnicus]
MSICLTNVYCFFDFNGLVHAIKTKVRKKMNGFGFKKNKLFIRIRKNGSNHNKQRGGYVKE